MKKLLLLLALFPVLAFSQEIQENVSEERGDYKSMFKEVNSKWALGFGGGVGGMTTDFLTGALSVNITIKGFHADYCGISSGEDHRHDVRVDKWKSDYYLSWHFGYQIPVSRNFRIIPLVGFWVVGTETTDGSDWTVSGGQINNKVSNSPDTSGFDYGAQFNFKAKKMLLYANVTRYSACAGIGFEFGGKKK